MTRRNSELQTLKQLSVYVKCPWNRSYSHGINITLLLTCDCSVMTPRHMMFVCPGVRSPLEERPLLEKRQPEQQASERGVLSLWQ